MYVLYAGALELFKKFYENPEQATVGIMQQLGRVARKLDTRFDISVKQLSAFRHFCVLVPNESSEQKVLEEATQNIVDLLEYAISYPELLPTRHDMVAPVFGGLRIYKVASEVLMVPKKPEIVMAMTKNFKSRLDKIMAKIVFTDTTLQYIQFAYQFAVNLHKTNAAIPDSRIQQLKDSIQEHFNSEADVTKITRLPP
jgi:hypothetical protein